MRQFCGFSARGLAQSPAIVSHLHSCRCEDPGRSRSTGHDATKDWPGKLGLLGGRKTFEVPIAVAKVENIVPAPLWWTGAKGASPSPQTLSVPKKLQRKAEEPASVPTTETQLSTGKVINVSKPDDQGTKCTLTACRVGVIEETPPARFRDLQHLLLVVNADLYVEYNSAGFVLKWLFDVMILGNDVIFYGESDVVYRRGGDMQRLWRTEKGKDPRTVPFYHARLPVYSWMSASVTTNM